MNPAQLILQDSGKTEYYTPVEIIEAARQTMGSIFFDPFSSPEANRTVRASHFMTKDHGELTFSAEWRGPLWMNHPFSRSMNPRCITKLLAEFWSGRVQVACCVTFASTSEEWFRPLLSFPQCFLSPRTHYLDQEGNPVRGVTKGSVVTLLAPDSYLTNFRYNFQSLGIVKV
jgi:hypothetical protein